VRILLRLEAASCCPIRSLKCRRAASNASKTKTPNNYRLLECPAKRPDLSQALKYASDFDGLPGDIAWPFHFSETS
jgi:hypothetical protein